MAGEIKGIWEALGVDAGGVAYIDQIMAEYNGKTDEMIKAVRDDYADGTLIPPAALFYFLQATLHDPVTGELDRATVLEFLLIFSVMLYREAIREG